jgi:hypothetical protein
MKKFGLVGVVAGALSVAVIGFSAPAQADDNGYVFGGGNNSDYGFGYGYGRDHRNNPWLDKIYPSVKVPQVDTSVRN